MRQTAVINTFFESRVEKLFDIADRLAAAMDSAGVNYRIVGGLAAYLHVEAAEPDAGRLTRDVDAAVDRRDLEKVVEAARRFGFEYRHAAGVDMLLDTRDPKSRRAVHLIFVGEKVRPVYAEPVPGFSQPARFRGLLVAPVADLVRMKLTSYRLKDRVHIQDLDGAGLITPEIEAQLPDLLRARLQEVRATE